MCELNFEIVITQNAPVIEKGVVADRIKTSLIQSRETQKKERYFYLSS